MEHWVPKESRENVDEMGHGVNEVAKVRRDHLVHLEGQVFLVALDSLDLREIEDHRELQVLLVSRVREEGMETLVKEELRVLPDQRERKETKVHLEIVGQPVVMDSLDCLVHWV